MPDFAAGEKATADKLNTNIKTLLRGVVRSGDSASTSGTTLLTWATTFAVNLPASSVIRVELQVRWFNNTDNDQFGFRIYDTSTAGAMLSDTVEKGYGGGPYNAFCSHTYTTGSAVVGQVFAATIHRVAGTGTALVKANSVIRVLREGDAGVYTAV